MSNPNNPSIDLLLKGGRVIDPANRHHADPAKRYDPELRKRYDDAYRANAAKAG